METKMPQTPEDNERTERGISKSTLHLKAPSGRIGTHEVRQARREDPKVIGAPAPGVASDPKAAALPVKRQALDGAGGVRPAGDGRISPGKEPSLTDFEQPSVANYSDRITRAWYKSVESYFDTAAYCADAAVQLTPDERVELISTLPFGDVTFSKFIRIGNKARSLAPEVRRHLPARYTIIYAITFLSDEELSLAIAAKIIRPDMKREDLEQWLASHRAPATPNASIADSHADNTNGGRHGAVAGNNEAPHDKAQPTGAQLDPVLGLFTADGKITPQESSHALVASPPIAPAAVEGIPSFLDRNLPSDEDRRVFDHLKAIWLAASEMVRMKFITDVLGNGIASIPTAE
jgi:hypothetical protein